jgi:uncharacterized membrane-anchored protein YitT (DUF2179 family)
MVRKFLSIGIGCLIVAFGVRCLTLYHLVTGGTAGLALAISYLSGISFGVMFFLINLPFYLLSIARMGKAFTLYTVLCVSLLSVLSDLVKHIAFNLPNPWVASILGGSMIGIGLVTIFRAGGSLGGANILALYLQQKIHLNAGFTNFVCDLIAVLLGCQAVGWDKGFFSLMAIFFTGICVSQYKNPSLLRWLRSTRTFGEQMES